MRGTPNHFGVTHPLHNLMEVMDQANTYAKLWLNWDFPGGPVVENPPFNAGNAGSIPGRGTKIPHAVGQLSPRRNYRARTPQRESPSATNYRAHVPQLETENLHATTREKPTHHNEDPACLNEDPASCN